VVPADRDCSSELDNDCDGLPDNTLDASCGCVVGTTQPCGQHAGQDGNGRCTAGVQTCVLSSDGKTSGFGACVGSVGPLPRDCTSLLDNDCDGRPDNTLDAVCGCTPNTTQACLTHPGQDGIGICRAGLQICAAGPGNASSAFGVCQGSVGPLATDSCTVLGDDSNCDGLPNGGCQCVAGQGNAPCSGTPAASRCGPLGTCLACQVDADCSLVAGGRSKCNAGLCVACVADADCGANGACQAGACVGCTSDAHCADPAASRCDQGRLSCAACIADADCSHLRGLNACSAGTCRECTATNQSACGAGELCDVPSGRCLTLSPAGRCDTCVSSGQCGAGNACVLEPAGGGFVCMPVPVGGTCGNAPFSRAVSLTEVGGSAVLACQPRLASCAALDIDGQSCAAATGCGAEAICVLPATTPPATSGTCSLPCVDASDCPAPRTCAAGACSRP
jgi:hypothetical protein